MAGNLITEWFVFMWKETFVKINERQLHKTKNIENGLILPMDGKCIRKFKESFLLMIRLKNAHSWSLSLSWKLKSFIYALPWVGWVKPGKNEAKHKTPSGHIRDISCKAVCDVRNRFMLYYFFYYFWIFSTYLVSKLTGENITVNLD